MAPENRPTADLITTIDSGTGSDKSPGSGRDIAAFAQGRYVVKRLLGEGGQKQVFLTHDEHLARDVVVAVLKMRLLDDRAVARLRSEARALARLGDHPHIVAVHDIGEEDGAPYIVAQYVDGGTLTQLIARGAVEVEDALRICGEVADALAYAHDNGLVHRDVKPGNIWLTKSGVAKLGDFGLAASLTQLSAFSRENTLLGTVAYVAPEQALGQTIDGRADLYSLGIVLYELVAGRRPFLGDTIAAVLSQHLNDPPVAPSWHNPGVPAQLDALILKLLAKSPHERPQTAREVAASLQSIAASLRAGLVTEAPRPTRPLDRLAAGVFVGRGEELVRLRECLDRALAGVGSVVQIVGDAGSGKSALAEQFATYAGLRGAHVLRAHCYEAEGAPAYWPWVQAIRTYVGTLSAERVLSLMGEAAPVLVQLDAEIARRLPTVAVPQSGKPDQTRFRLFDGVATFFRNVSQAQPLVVLIDDLQWMDEASLRLLQFVARDAANCRLVIVVTMRPVVAGAQSPLGQTLGGLARLGLDKRIVLDGLSEADVHRFVEMTTATTPAPTLVAAIHERTEGNAFFVKEVVRLLVTEGQLDGGPSGQWNLRLPETVREVVTLRLTQLSEPCNRLLAAAAVVGREFDVETVRSITDLADEQLLDALDEAIAARIVAESPKHPGRCRFSHALIRETLSESMSASRRARVHLKIATVLEQASPESREVNLAALAHHFSEAIPLGQAQKAFEYAVLAAQRADGRLAYEEAAKHYQLALRALDWVAQGEPQRRAELLLKLGDVQMKAGASSESRESFLQAADLARQAAAPVTFALAVLGLGAGTAVRTKLGHAIDQVELKHLHEALASIPADAQSLRGRLLAQLALALYHEPANRLRRSAEAVEVSRAAGEAGALLAALYSRCVALEGLPRAQERHALAVEMVAIAEQAGDTENVLRGRFRCFRELMELCDIPGVERELDAYAALADTTRQPRYRWYVPYGHAVLAGMRGDFTAADTLLTEALAIGQRAQDPNATLFCGVVRYACLWQKGSAAEIEKTLTRMIDAYPATSKAWRIQLVRLYCLIGRLDDARGIFAGLAQADFDDLTVDGSFTSTLAALATICWALDDSRRARLVYERLLPFAEFNLVAGNSANCGGALSLPLAIAAAASGDSRGAQGFFEDAIARDARTGARPWLVHAYVAYAQMLMSRGSGGDVRAAQDLARRARILADELGMNSLWFAGSRTSLFS